MPRPTIALLLSFLLFFGPAGLQAQDKPSLPRSTPEAESVSSRDILAFLDTLASTKNEFHSLMILRHGRVIAEGWWSPYRADLRHMMYSVSKSFTSTAVGLAISEGRFSLSDKVQSFFPGDMPDSGNAGLAQVTVKDLITMAVGQRPDPTAGAMAAENWARYFLSRPIADTPGLSFLYNSLGTYMLSAVVQKSTGQTVLDYLRPRLFEPLGISGMDWETSPQGIDAGGWGLRVKTEDMARFGQLFLQKGLWQGKQVLPANWVEEATSYQINQLPNLPAGQRARNDWAQGYGYQFWRCRHNAYRADGAFGQYIIMLPEQDAVIAITSESASMQDELNLVWDFLLPAFRKETLAADPAAEGLLRKRLAGLSLNPPPRTPASKIQPEISGRHFKLDSNEMNYENLSFDFHDEGCRLTITEDGNNYGFECGAGNWHLGESRLPGITPSILRAAYGPYEDLGPTKYAAAYSWQDENTLVFAIRLIESPHTRFITIHFSDEKISVAFETSYQRLMLQKPGWVSGLKAD